MAAPEPTQTLDDILKKHIGEKGPVPFSEYMGLALYHPELGYYSRTDASPDYYTNADVHPLFGRILARTFHELWKKDFARAEAFQIVELGCGKGKLAGHVLGWLEENAPDCFARLRYRGVETSAKRRAAFSENLSAFAKTAAVQKDFDFAEGSLEGVIFSNEFFDALPFDRVAVEGGRLKEIRVTAGLGEERRDAGPEIADYFSWLGVRPQEGCVGEAQPAVRAWTEKIARALNRGAVLSVDYGYEAEELYSDFRTEGTALCHFQNRTNRDFYKNPGLQDITAHVNFSVLRKEGERRGLKTEAFQTQSRFLLDRGLDDMVAAVEKTADARARLKTSSAVKSLVHPEGLGGTFKVLLQTKNL